MSRSSFAHPARLHALGQPRRAALRPPRQWRTGREFSSISSTPHSIVTTMRHGWQTFSTRSSPVAFGSDRPRHDPQRQFWARLVHCPLSGVKVKTEVNELRSLSSSRSISHLVESPCEKACLILSMPNTPNKKLVHQTQHFAEPRSVVLARPSCSNQVLMAKIQTLDVVNEHFRKVSTQDPYTSLRASVDEASMSGDSECTCPLGKDSEVCSESQHRENLYFR